MPVAPGPAIVEDAIGTSTRSSSSSGRRAFEVRRGRPIFGRTVDYVLKHSPTRVLVAAGRRAA